MTSSRPSVGRGRRPTNDGAFPPSSSSSSSLSSSAPSSCARRRSSTRSSRRRSPRRGDGGDARRRRLHCTNSGEDPTHDTRHLSLKKAQDGGARRGEERAVTRGDGGCTVRVAAKTRLMTHGTRHAPSLSQKSSRRRRSPRRGDGADVRRRRLHCTSGGGRKDPHSVRARRHLSQRSSRRRRRSSPDARGVGGFESLARSLATRRGVAARRRPPESALRSEGVRE